MEIVTRKDAIAKGLSRYFTGIPCPKWHISERRTKAAECLECIKLAKKLNILRNPETVAARRKRHYTRNVETILLYQQNYNINRSPEEKRITSEYMKEWRKKRYALNGGKRPWKPMVELDVDELDKRRATYCCRSSVRRGASLPDGVTIKEMIQQTVHLFKLKRERESETGKRHYIDHIVPICIGGMHEPGNLQVLSEDAHKEKTFSDMLMHRKRVYITKRRVQLLSDDSAIDKQPSMI